MTSVRSEARNCRAAWLLIRCCPSQSARNQEGSREFTESALTSRRPTSLHGQNVELACQQCCHSYHNLDDFKSACLISEMCVGKMASARTSNWLVAYDIMGLWGWRRVDWCGVPTGPPCSYRQHVIHFNIILPYMPSFVWFCLILYYLMILFKLPRL
jgi:hypothetical protein